MSTDVAEADQAIAWQRPPLSHLFVGGQSRSLAHGATHTRVEALRTRTSASSAHIWRQSTGRSVLAALASVLANQSCHGSHGARLGHPLQTIGDIFGAMLRHQVARFRQKESPGPNGPGL
jgi:hypothetical protein